MHNLHLQYSQHILQFLQICHEAIQILHADELQGTLVYEILVEWSEERRELTACHQSQEVIKCYFNHSTTEID